MLAQESVLAPWPRLAGRAVQVDLVLELCLGRCHFTVAKLDGDVAAPKIRV